MKENLANATYFLEIAYEVRTIMHNVKVTADKALAFVRDKYELDKNEFATVKGLVEVYN